MKNTLLSLVLGLLLASAQAGPGHDHGDDAAPAAVGTALPRFAASSELFELVGVLDGRRLTLYLDRAETNEPVSGAQLELELAGQKLAVKALPDGSYQSELAAVPASGVHALTASVSAGDDSDLLAGELDLRGGAHEAHAEQGGWKRGLAWVAAGLAGLALLGLALRKQAKWGAA